MNARLFADGGARGNPGPAAIGVVIEFPGTDRAPVEIAERIGEATNNVAEYQAILRGLAEARAHGAVDVDCRLDSELVVKQLRGEYRVRNHALQELARQVVDLVRRFRQVTFTAVPRAQNRRADALVNRALDLGQ